MPKGRWTLPFSDGHASLGFLLYSFWPFRPQVMDPVTKLKLLFFVTSFTIFFSFLYDIFKLTTAVGYKKQNMSLTGLEKNVQRV